MAMSSKDSEGKRRRKDHDRDKEGSTKGKDKERHRSSRSSRKVRSSSKEHDRLSEGRQRSATTPTNPPSKSSRKAAMAAAEMERCGSAGDLRANLPYPTFSKAHSKEAVASREDIGKPKGSLYTPDATDIGAQAPVKDDPGGKQPATVPPGGIPPSPPLTAAEPSLNQNFVGMSLESESVDNMDGKGQGEKKEETQQEGVDRTPSRGSKSSARHKSATDDSTSASKAYGVSHPVAGRVPTPQTFGTTERPLMSPIVMLSGARSEGPPSQPQSTITKSTTDSDATSIAPHRVPSAKPPTLLSHHDSSLASHMGSSPRTPTAEDTLFPPVEPDRKERPPIGIVTDDFRRSFGPPRQQPTPATFPATAPPPPPPPPVQMPGDAPRVDYLLHNGGLPHSVPRNFLLPLLHRMAITSSRNQGSGQQMSNVPDVFAPLQTLLENYTQVLVKHGSIAVATGYRSVARRLLDRLEAVFARNISSESCTCIMCKFKLQSVVGSQEEAGVSWGEILEYVSGRRELPPWPPFTIESKSTGLGISDHEPTSPMQKLDVDVPEEYRDHYVRQSRKTKQAVSDWLSSQPELPSSPPDEVDDDTLTFTMLTHLERENRQLFTALIRGLATLPGSRAPTPLTKIKPDLMVKCSLALQRLYRLPRPPRDAECAIYLLKSPDLHGVLATLAAVSAGEWEILVSGRFDGFLWSGAENGNGSQFGPPSLNRGVPSTPSRNLTGTTPSRTTTPYSVNNNISRGQTPFSGTGTPFSGIGSPPLSQSRMPLSSTSTVPPPSTPSFGAPVQLDEETEIAVLAEVEREIYLGMEALEDAFEVLHSKAESVRHALRERSAGLALASQTRRGSSAESVGVRLGTPATAWGGQGNGGTSVVGWDSETDDGIDDGRSELAPDDSASNIGSRRRRRPERRSERQTPAPVEEEDEDDFQDAHDY